ncbi:hypothetical protein JCM10207_006997 [Rhodosporidiobolus poonsookiae]
MRSDKDLDSPPPSPGVNWTLSSNSRDPTGPSAWVGRVARLRSVRLIGVFALGVLAHQLLVTFSGVDTSAAAYSFLPSRFTPSSTTSSARPLRPYTGDAFVRNIEDRLVQAPLLPYQQIVGTVARKDSPDILPWLLSHVHAGFDHFVIFNNGATDETSKRLRTFVELGWVTVVGATDASDASISARFHAEWKGRSERATFLSIGDYRVIDPANPADEPLSWNDHYALRESLNLAVTRFEERYPSFHYSDFSLSRLTPTLFSTRRQPLPASFSGGETLIVDSTHSDVGYLEVILKSARSIRYLPVVYQEEDNSASFVIPTVADAGSYELVITRQYASSPDPAADPVSQCSVVPHIAKWPEQPQLMRLAAGDCHRFEPSAWRDISFQTWAHPRFRGEVLFRRSLHLQPAPAARPSLSPSSPLSLTQLGQGRWQAYPLAQFPSATQGAPRLYTCDRFPHFFQQHDWDASAGHDSCGNDTVLDHTGYLRWTPDDASTFLDSTLTAEEVKSCAAASPNRPDGLRVVFVGDSVSWHSMLGLASLFESVGLSVWQTFKHHNFQYEMFDMVRGAMSVEAWEKFFSWEFDSDKGTVASNGAPDVIVMNVGLWAASWGDTPGFESGLRDAFTFLRAFADKHNIRVFWRETTAVFSALGGDPLYQVNPRIERLNAVANSLVREFGFALVPAFAMTRPRIDAAHDNAHTGPLVQGDMAELLLYSICKARPE